MNISTDATQTTTDEPQKNKPRSIGKLQRRGSLRPEDHEKLLRDSANRAARVEISREGLKLYQKDQSEFQPAPATAEQTKQGTFYQNTRSESVPAPRISSHAPTELERTGYAEVDNAIVDALKTVDEDVKFFVHDLMRYDFLRSDMDGMTENERQELISFGVAQAQYIADNYMNEETGKSFMEAIDRVAKISAKGKADASGHIEYELSSNRDILDGEYTEKLTDTVGLAKYYSPETYRKFQEMTAKCDETDDPYEKCKIMADAMMSVMTWLVDAVQKDPGMIARFEGRRPYDAEEMKGTKVSDVFTGANTSNISAFADSIRQLFQNSGARWSLFENRMNALTLLSQTLDRK